MKLTRLELTSFRAAQGLTLNVDASRVLISGINGAGKTTIREAVKWCLRGLSEVTDQRGSGAELLAPHGTSEVAVKVHIDGIGEVSRLYSHGGGTAFSVEGFTGAAGTQQQALYAKLNTSPEFLDCVLDTDAFRALHHGDAKALVLNLLNVRVDFEGSPKTLDELDVLYKAAFEQRKEAKRQLQMLPLAPTVAIPESLKPRLESTGSASVAELLPKIEGRLTEIREEQGTLRQTLGETIGRRAALTAERTRVAATPTPGTDVAALEAKRAALQAEIAQDVEQPLVSGSPDRRLIQMLRSKEQALEQHQPSAGCVLDSEVPCKTAQKLFAARAVAVRQEADVLSQQGAATPTAAPRDLQRELQGVQDSIKRYLQQQAAAEQAGGRLAEIDEDLSSLPETGEQEQRLAAFTEQIGRGDALLKDAQTYLAAVKATDQAVAARKALVDKVAALESRVEELGPKGLRVPALTAAMGAFETAINEYLEPWGWTVSFVVEPWTVTVNGREWRTYSKSERYRIGLAVQFALAQMSGLSFALVDEADMLDREKRQALARLIAVAPLDQVIMFATREPSEPLPGAHPGWIFVRLDQSRVAEIVAA